jgi:NADH-quinone oxidoreductase subunit C
MNDQLATLAESIGSRFGDRLERIESQCGELTYEVGSPDLVDICRALRDEAPFAFEQLIDLTGVDYLDYGRDEWNTESATGTGFSRGVERGRGESPMGESAARERLHGVGVPDKGAGVTVSVSAGANGSPTAAEASTSASSLDSDTETVTPAPLSSPRFAVAYHLLSVSTNRRLRLRAYCEAGEPPMLDSVIGVWKSADWYEREAFDLYGIVFRGHPDLRRILTDYGFIGHPFRKDFPLIGNVEVRYDATLARVVYEPVSIEPRTLVPKVIREDNRWEPAIRDTSARG